MTPKDETERWIATASREELKALVEALVAVSLEANVLTYQYVAIGKDEFATRYPS